jgi:dTDP-4-dehydrorhamnose reductase
VRWLVTGANGQLGRELGALLTSERDGATADHVRLAGSAELDIADAPAVTRMISDERPDVVINAAAYTAVDDAETDEAAAYRVNATGPANLAVALSAVGGRLVHVSTDYVFDGQADEPYATDAPTNPQSAYGRTKRDGELAVREVLADASYVVRTAWLYGVTGRNFVATMARFERERESIDVVDDQTGSPTFARDLATALVALGRSLAPAGIYHVTNAGTATWFEFARAVFAELGADRERVRPTTTAAFPRPAPRPAYSVLAPDAWLRAGFPALPPWQDALHRAMPEIRAALAAD